MRRSHGHLQDVLVAVMQNVYNSELKLTKALPKFIKTACSSHLASVLEQYFHEGEARKERLELAFENLGVSTFGKGCDAVNGLIQESKDLISDYTDSPAGDVALICATQLMAHYQIATYGCICAWAETLGAGEVCDLLWDSLQDAKLFDEHLTDLANTEINAEAQVAYEF